MYSQCPECQTRFRVTAEALRAAHGTVRCGRCGSAFDALARLSDTVPAKSGNGKRTALPETGAGLAAVTGPHPVAEYHFSAADLEKVFVDARDWQRQFETSPPAAAASQEAVTPTVMVQEDEPFEDITLEGERISIEARPDLEELLDSAAEDEPSGEFAVARAEDREPTAEFWRAHEPYYAEPAPAEPTADEHLAGEPQVFETEPPEFDAREFDERANAFVPEMTEADVWVPPGRAAREAARPAPTLASQRWRAEVERPPPVTEPEEPHAGSAFGALAWTLGSVVLALALAAQLAHHYRQDLVRHPRLGAALHGIYGRLGVELSPNWDLAAFEVRQWGSNSDAAPDDGMTVRASLTNRAGFAQPHPILRLELEDRFGDAVAVRDFEPGEYLKDGSEASRLLASGATTEAELLIADPGREAVGYRLDVCLRESAALLRCAQGPG